MAITKEVNKKANINVLNNKKMGKSCPEEKRAEEEQRQALRQLDEENKERILAIAFHFIPNLQEAEDILQESYVKAFRFFSSGQAEGNSPSSSNLSSWIYRIAFNTPIDFC